MKRLAVARGAPLDEFLSLVEQAKSPTMHVPDWHARIGADFTGVLARLGVLVAAEPATWFPCGGAWGDGCPRRVVENRGCASHPFVALCGRDDGSCVEVLLRAGERDVLTFSLDGLARQLRRVLGFGGAVERDVGFPDARRLGERAGRPVFLALSPALPGFDAWLAARGDALVLVPVGRGLPTALRDRFASGQRLELVTLRAILRVDDDALVGALPERVLQVREPAGVPYGTRPAVCVVIDHEGQRALNADEYRSLVARARELDLFVDTTVTVDGGAHRGVRRDDDGAVEEAALTKHEAASIIELISSRKALRAGDFATVAVNAVDKVVERARSKIDVKQGRYKWRAIHTLAADTPAAKRWQFNPPSAMTFAAVQPIP